MSNNNKRRRRNRNANADEAEFFVYTEGVTVPRNVTHVLVHASVEVLPDLAFRACRRLKEVVLQEGVREIGYAAFRNCQALKYVGLPSTLLKIGVEAFRSCVSLGDLDLPEGLLEIGNLAFDGIGNASLGGTQIVLPTSLIDIGYNAFSCRTLMRAKLCRGVQRIEGPAYDNRYLTIPSKSLIFDTWPACGQGDYKFHLATTNGPIPWRIYSHHPHVAITSECFNSMSKADMSELQHAITEVLGLGSGWDEQHGRFRSLIAPHELRHEKEVTTLLELSLWKARLDASDRANSENREGCRLNCGASVIIPSVLPFL